MKIRLIEPKAPGPSVYDYARMPRLGLALLATILVRLGHDVRVYVEVLSSVDWDDIKSSDLVGFSTITSTAPAAYEMAQLVQSAGIPTVIGGSHATFLPDEALQHCDFVVRGEGQKTLPELVTAIRDGTDLSDITGLSYRDKKGVYHNPDRPPCSQKEFEKLPIPDLELIVAHHRMRYIPVSTSWGCPYSCEFCSVVPMFGRQMRYRPVESILDELEYLGNQTLVFFVDDNFVVDKKRTKKILRGMIERNLKISWTAQMRAQAVFKNSKSGELDHELLDLMKQSGCKAVYNGFESVDQATLDALNKRQSVQTISDAISAFHSYGFHVHGMFVFGADTDSSSSFQKTADFALDHQIDSVQFVMLTPYPGTKLRDNLAAQGRLLDVDWSLFDAHHCTFVPKQMSPLELQTRTHQAMERFYSVGNSIAVVARNLPRLLWSEQKLWAELLLGFSSNRLEDQLSATLGRMKQAIKLPLMRIYALKQLLEQERRAQQHLKLLADAG